MKNLKRALLIIIAICAIVSVAMLSTSCNGGDDETTTTPVTELPEHMDAVNYESVTSKKMGGLRPFSVVSDDPWVASANVPHNHNSIAIVAYHSGTATLTVSDCFGFEAKVRVTVADDDMHTITYEVLSHQMDDFYEVQTDGGVAADGVTDVTEKLQGIIDAAAPGDTIYFYPGNYKITWLVMRDDVHLNLATTMTDATLGYNAEIKSDYESGYNIAILSSGHIMNNERGERGAEGASNFSITGGAFSGYFIFTCADNVQISNVIVKDLTDAHSFQITGCTNVTIKNCMFAGYTFKTAFPREVIQIEQSHPGATGDASNAPLTFQAGEFHVNENIAIEGCYFGKSDNMDPPVIAIGHHGYVGMPTVTGFTIKGNVFDGCKHSAIRYTNIINTEITDNKFVAYSEYKTIQADGATRPAFIIIYDAGANMTTYKSSVTGSTVTIPTYQSGTHNLLISRNTFDIEAGSDKRVFDAIMSNTQLGAAYVSGIYTAESFDSLPRAFSGYVDRSNTLSNMTFSDNVINIAGQPTYQNMFFNSQYTHDVKVENNTVNLEGGASFSTATDGMEGFSIKTNVTGEAALRRVITLGKTTKSRVVLCGAEGEELFGITGSAPAQLTVTSDGNGRVSTHCDGGNVYVSVEASEGYAFVGWKNGSSDVKGDLSIGSTTTITAVFAAK